jgi:hypothetical protein
MLQKVLTLEQFWLKAHVFSMEKRIAPASALCTTHCALQQQSTNPLWITTTINQYEFPAFVSNRTIQVGVVLVLIILQPQQVRICSCYQ